jgi:large subunit ribosomal protein L13
MDTFFPKEADLDKKWYVADADQAVLGRLSARIASILRGKHKATYTPHTDMGDFVIVINAEKIRMTGNKLQQDVRAVQRLSRRSPVGQREDPSRIEA